MTGTITRRDAPAHGWRGLLLVSAAGVVWGTIAPAVQVAHDASGLSPYAISAYRAVAALVALFTAVLATSRLPDCRGLTRRSWRRVVVTGTATAAFQLLDVCRGGGPDSLRPPRDPVER